MNPPSSAAVPPQAEASPGSPSPLPGSGARSGFTHLKPELVRTIKPSSGKLQILKTKAEAEAGLTLVEAHIVCILSKDANDAKKLIDNALPPHAISHLQHLRRVAKFDFLPQSVKDYLQTATPKYDSSSPSSPSSDEFPRHPPLQKTTSSSSSRTSSKSKKPKSRGSSRSRPRRLYLIAAPTCLISTTELALVLQPYTTQIHALPIPYTPPSSQDEALEWSTKYWPVAYKAHNPFGPQPVFVSKAVDAMAPAAGLFIALAREAARQTHRKGLGEAFGAVIVDPSACFDGPVPVAAAGDARWRETRQDSSSGTKDSRLTAVASDQRNANGNPAAHAVLRAIGMIARQRVALVAAHQTQAQEASSQQRQIPETPSDRGFFLDQTVTNIEESIREGSQLLKGGYLCSGLEIWLSHEPCVMCSMAILHSRFERVVFGKRMPATGGMVGERAKDIVRGAEKENVQSSKAAADKKALGDSIAGLGYGLFWRPELNWKMLAWEWVDDEAPFGKASKNRRRAGSRSRSPGEMVHV